VAERNKKLVKPFIFRCFGHNPVNDRQTPEMQAIYRQNRPAMRCDRDKDHECDVPQTVSAINPI
jgi:hypothetical protein